MRFAEARALAATTFALTACAGVTPYQPAGLSGGYEDVKVDSNTFRVQFGGNTGASRLRVESYLLYRCAEVTLGGGFDYFMVIHCETIAYSPYGGAERYASEGREASQTTYVHGEAAKYVSTCVIKGFRGAKPANDAAAFDAREVIWSLDQMVVR